MAIPENLKSIATNLPLPRLTAFLSALEQGNAQHVLGSTGVFSETFVYDFDFEGAKYSMKEIAEVVASVYLKSANPSFVRTLIDELEAGLSVVVKERNYDEAKVINRRIEDLQSLIRV